MSDANEQTSDQQPIGKLASKIEAVAADLNGLKKDGKNQFSNYEYISASQLDRELRTLFQKHKISVLPELVDYQEHVGTSDKGKETIRTVVHMSFQIIDHDTGFTLEKRFYGMEQDTGGKSMQQAITQCVKYFYFKLFRVSDSKDTDPDHKTTERAGYAQRSAPAAPQKPVTAPAAPKPSPAPSSPLTAAPDAPKPTARQLEEIETLMRQLGIDDEAKSKARKMLTTAANAEIILAQLKAKHADLVETLKAEDDIPPVPEDDETIALRQIKEEVKALITPSIDKAPPVQLEEAFAAFCGSGTKPDTASLIQWQTVHKILKARRKEQEKQAA